MPGLPNHPILYRAITALPVSRAFLAMAEQNNFHTLSDIVESDMNRFPKLPGSGYNLLAELLALLKEHDLMHLVEEPLP